MTQSVETLVHLAETRLAQRDLPAAIAAFDQAEAVESFADRCAGGRWMAHMLAGDFAAAWLESDAIRRRGAPDPHRFWTGEDLRGRRIILRCLHGCGDAVQFLRYVPRVKALATGLVVEIAPAMVEIAALFDGVEEVITWGAAAPAAAPQWDLQLEVLELPYVFRTEAHELPLAEHYLRLPTEVQSRAARAMGSSSSPRVGIVWAAGEWNPGRSLPFHLLKPVLQGSACEFANLQGGKARGEWQSISGAPHLHDAAYCNTGILPLAATIAQLDLVITVDTLAAHLAGALGKPAWLLLQYAADWRWMVQRSDTPWYPSLRLFRQPRKNDWESTLSTVAQELTHWLATRNEPQVAA